MILLDHTAQRVVVLLGRGDGVTGQDGVVAARGLGAHGLGVEVVECSGSRPADFSGGCNTWCFWRILVVVATPEV